MSASEMNPGTSLQALNATQNEVTSGNYKVAQVFEGMFNHFRKGVWEPDSVKGI